jgi:hypothetical protein
MKRRPAENEAAETMRLGFELLCTYARTIALLPLEDWQQALEQAETVAPVIDPTLFREYLYSDKTKILKSILTAAIPLKRAVLAAQPVSIGRASAR